MGIIKKFFITILFHHNAIPILNVKITGQQCKNSAKLLKIRY